MHRNFKKRKPNLVQKWNQTWISLLEKRDPNSKQVSVISHSPLGRPLYRPQLRIPQAEFELRKF